jgi:hypothetical protein
VKIISTSFLLSIYLSINITLYSQKNDSTISSKLIQNTIISGQYFMAYNYNDGEDLHNFLLKRGYFTLKTDIDEVFSVRYTQDITLDEEGEDSGNIELRLKYLYLKAKMNSFLFFTNSYVELGVVHTPWIDFEQNINQYRVQGKMFSERFDLLNSADFGITMAGLIGGEIDKEYQNEVNNKEPGKYGSFALGFFNGGGYYNIEENSNKTFQSRLTLRPLPDKIPGLQLSHGFAYGKVNKNDSIPVPDYIANLFMLSSESKFHKLTAQYHIGTGDFEGKYVDATSNEGYDNEGYSFFGEFLIPNSNFAVFSRYDHFKIYEATTISTETIIAGLTYRFLKNKLLLDYQQTRTPNRTINYYEFAIEIAF